MGREWGWRLRAVGHEGLITVFGFTVVLAALTGFTRPAQALPSFARQTGQPCGTCHTDFPALTPFGRRFKLIGYTVGGGAFKTTPFSDAPPRFAPADDARAQAEQMRAYAKEIASGPSEEDKEYVPPISMMAIAGFTRTDSSLPPPTAPYAPNNNVVLSPFSGFWGGAITDHIG